MFKSRYFHQLTLDETLPDYPCLNGFYRRASGDVEVALIGHADMTQHWESFLRKSEDALGLILEHENKSLQAALPEIHKKHRAYFGDRWSDLPEALLKELALRLICFYTDGSVHFWYSGSAAFNHLDVDLGFNADLKLTEVRFDG